mmetsp:Transcript_160170/g.282505  ORF Transcript_160170/g.282505 Transcript_160170/m.282505 type:complete len:290 (+) Transcript_160170:290-1159(+)
MTFKDSEASNRKARKPNRKKNDARSAKAGVQQPPSIASPEVYCWREHPSVWFAVYGGRHSLRLACARTSVFLEDHELAGCVLNETPRSCDHAAAQYSGHNFSPQGLLGFAHAAGPRLSPSEDALLAALAKAGAFSSKCAPGCAGVLALGKGLSRQECEDTLVHECMHGLFYGHSLLQQAVNDHWQNVLSDNQRIAWIRFLVNHGYNAERDQELAVNELLAYMCTEKQLFSENSSQIQEVRSIRKDFVEAIQHQVPLPAPSVGQAGCIWEWPPSSALSAEVSKGRRSKRR